jgi:hypothetical protein
MPVNSNKTVKFFQCRFQPFNAFFEVVSAAKSLIENGASFIATEDPILVGEFESWAVMLKSQQSNTVASELLQQSLEERIKYISDRIVETLEDSGTGVLFIEPDSQVEFDKDIKIIRVCPFDPSDYLRSWQMRRKLKLQAEE